MQLSNSVDNANKSSNYHDKVVSKLFIFALPIIILSPILPILIIYLPPNISHIFTSIVAIYLGLILLTLTTSMFFSNKISTRLAGIPTNFVMGLFLFIIYKLGLYRLVLNAFSIGEAFSLTAETVDETMKIIPLVATIGIWLSVLPIIIYSLRIFFKSKNKGELTNTIDSLGVITNVTDTRTKLNNYRIYNISVDISTSNGQTYVGNKDFVVPDHIIHLISIGKKVDIKIDNDNVNDFYIITEYGVL